MNPEQQKSTTRKHYNVENEQSKNRERAQAKRKQRSIEVLEPCCKCGKDSYFYVGERPYCEDTCIWKDLDLFIREHEVYVDNEVPVDLQDCRPEDHGGRKVKKVTQQRYHATPKPTIDKDSIDKEKALEDWKLLILKDC